MAFQIPGTVEEVIALDKDNGNKLWQDSIKVENTSSCVVFKLCEKGEKVHLSPNFLLEIECD